MSIIKNSNARIFVPIIIILVGWKKSFRGPILYPYKKQNFFWASIIFWIFFIKFFNFVSKIFWKFSIFLKIFSNVFFKNIYFFKFLTNKKLSRKLYCSHLYVLVRTRNNKKYSRTDRLIAYNSPESENYCSFVFLDDFDADKKVQWK